MGVEPSACIVVEDSTSGVAAAQAAEMDVVGFLGGGHAKADWCAADAEEIVSRKWTSLGRRALCTRDSS